MSKPDKSSRVPQRDKLKDGITLRELNWTGRQKEFISLALDKKTKVIILDGGPGTAKTLLSVYSSLRLLSEKKIGEIVYIRSLVQSTDGATGYLSGDLNEKIQYYNYPLFDKLEELLPKSHADKLFQEERIKTFPTSMLRGYNFNATAIIGDELQNFSFDSIYTLVTRAGEFSKVFLAGDSVGQNDLGKRSGFKRFIEIFNNEESREQGIFYFPFTDDDIMRSQLVKFIVQQVNKFNCTR